MTQMTQQEIETVRALREKGYVVVLWSPEEIGQAWPSTLEDIVISGAAQYLEQVNSEGS